MTRQNETESDRAAMTAAFETWRDATTPVTDIFAPEMIWEIVGHSAGSRVHVNKKESIDEVLAPFGRCLSTTDALRPVTIGRV
jgi:hypothetical protein